MSVQNAASDNSSDPQGTAGTTPEPNTTPTGAAASGEPKEKTYTEAEVSAMVATRLSKQERQLKAQIDAEVKKLAERAGMEESERLKAERDDLQAQLEAERAGRTEAEHRATLAGKVTDADYALFRINQAPDKYLKDGSVNVEAFLKDHPGQAVNPDPKSGPAATSAGGNNQKNVDMNTLIRNFGK